MVSDRQDRVDGGPKRALLVLGLIVTGLLVVGGLRLASREDRGPARGPGSVRANAASTPLDPTSGDLPPPPPPSGRWAPHTGATPVPTRIDPTDHLEVGQTFAFQTVVKNAQLVLQTDEVWTVRSFTATELRYDMVSTTQMRFLAPNMPTQRPRITRRLNQRYPLTPTPGSARRRRLPQPKPVGTELISVDGVDFDCKIYAANGTKSWVSERFPGAIKMESTSTTRTLLKITPPGR